MITIKRLSGFLFILVLFAVAFTPSATGGAQDADRAFINGNVYTVDADFSTASAFAVKDGKFIYVGDDAGVKAYIGPRTFVSDLEGKTVIPGLHDSHVHIRYGERILYPRIPDIRPAIGEWASVERMQEVIKRCLATGEGMRPGPEPRWLVLSGWMSDVWDPPEFRKELIDAVAPDNPVFISRYTHGSAANSKAQMIRTTPAASTRKPRSSTTENPVSPGASMASIPRMMAMTPKTVMFLPPALTAYLDRFMMFSFPSFVVNG